MKTLALALAIGIIIVIFCAYKIAVDNAPLKLGDKQNPNYDNIPEDE